MEAIDDTTPRVADRRRMIMADVGRLAGVSHQTVSRVINGSPHVRPETRQRVLAAMRELGYQPNSVARALVTGRSNTLGVVSFDTTLYGPASTLFGIERAAHEAGYFIIVASLKALDRASVTRGGRAPARARRRRDPRDRAAGGRRRGAAARAPGDPAGGGRGGTGQARFRWSPSTSSPAPRLATRHLLDLGHQTVWHLAGPRGLPRGAAAAGGLARTRSRRQASNRPQPLFGDWSARAGYELGRR